MRPRAFNTTLGIVPSCLRALRVGTLQHTKAAVPCAANWPHISRSQRTRSRRSSRTHPRRYQKSKRMQKRSACSSSFNRSGSRKVIFGSLFHILIRPMSAATTRSVRNSPQSTVAADAGYAPCTSRFRYARAYCAHAVSFFQFSGEDDARRLVCRHEERDRLHRSCSFVVVGR